MDKQKINNLNIEKDALFHVIEAYVILYNIILYEAHRSSIFLKLRDSVRFFIEKM